MKKAIPVILLIVCVVSLIGYYLGSPTFSVKTYLKRFDNLPQRPDVPSYHRDLSGNIFSETKNFFNYIYDLLTFAFDYVVYFWKVVSKIFGAFVV